MKVLGVHSFTHDLGAALCIDGSITYAVEEERLSRIKHHPGIESEGTPPNYSIDYVLKEAGLKLQDLDLIVHVGWPGSDFQRLNIAEERFRNYARQLDPSGKKTKFVPHHNAHAASAYYASGFEKSLVVAVDGGGDWASTSMWIGDGMRLSKVDEYFLENSLGFMYSRAAKILGLGAFGFGEGKMTALAGYGNYMQDFHPLIEFNDQKYRIIEGYYDFFKNFERNNSQSLEQKHKDFACTVQTKLEDAL